MERQLLRGIKQRAETLARESATPPTDRSEI
jgi:hypothetical protein